MNGQFTNSNNIGCFFNEFIKKFNLLFRIKFYCKTVVRNVRIIFQTIQAEKCSTGIIFRGYKLTCVI